MSRWDLVASVSKRPDQVIGASAILVVVLLLLAVGISSPIPMYVASIPVAIIGIALMSASGRDEE